MANKYTNELYEKIKNSFSEKKGGTFKNVLKTKPENSYQVRIIPNTDDPTKTLFQYYLHGWSNPNDGQYVSTICPTTYGEECPICRERFRLWNKGDDPSKALSKLLARKERFYANVYVVDDPVTPANNGTVKILGYGRQLAKVIEESMSGEEQDEVGARMFDFTKEGCNLRIKVEKNAAGFPNYDRSKFLSPSSVQVEFDDAFEQSHDFDPLLIRKTDTEMKEMIESALYGNEEPASEPSAPAVKAEAKTEPVKDDIPMDFDNTEESGDILEALENI